MLIIIEQKKEVNIVYMASTREGPSAPVSPGPHNHYFARVRKPYCRVTRSESICILYIK